MISVVVCGECGKLVGEGKRVRVLEASWQRVCSKDGGTGVVRPDSVRVDRVFLCKDCGRSL